MRATTDNLTVEPPDDFPRPGCVAMAEPYHQFYAVAQLALGLSTYYARIRSRPDVFVAANMELHYNQRGEPVSKLAPDLMVAFGAAGNPESSFRIWEQGKAPDFVLEVVSRSTQKRDRSRKKEIYQSIGVQEYWLFDPTGSYIEPRLQAYRLEHGTYAALKPQGSRDGGLWSAVLELQLRADGTNIRLLDTKTGVRLPTAVEALAERLKANADHAAEVQAGNAAEANRGAKAQARREAETGQQAQAQARHAAETGQQAQAQTRHAAETGQQAQAQTRHAAETGQQAQAQTRHAAETGRQAQAQARREAETGRQAQAQARHAAETGQQAQAQARHAAETGQQAQAQARRTAEVRAAVLERNLERLVPASRASRSRRKR